MNPYAALQNYQQIVVLTDGCSTPQLAKTAISLLRYRPSDICAVFDREHAGRDAGQLFPAGHGVPVVGQFPPQADAVFVGIASPGGRLPVSWRPVLTAALRQGLDLVSGLHEFLTSDDELVQLAKERGCRLIDVRRNSEFSTSSGEPLGSRSLRIHTVGQDCSVGKMVATLELERELKERAVDARFLATGQTGIMIAGDGVPIDCVVADFVNGAAERLVRRHEQHEILLIEGQGSLSHPSFSAVTAGLLNGCAPQGLIYCYEIGREHVKGLDNVRLRSHGELMNAYLTMAALRHPCSFIGIAMNGRFATAAQVSAERRRMQSEFGLPVCDVYRDGPGLLADAVLQRKQERSE
ncbi:MAG: DUF1611 domain-containing protein [Planctomycetaceae bacterium]|nr:DUF1611 domain-containing protein [Planctomycetaceae bacterium]